MRLNEIKSVMSEVKDYIEERCKESSSYFFDDIKNQEIDLMLEHYPEIDKLSAKAFQFLWKKV